jgi:hypothetical protein
MSNNPQLSTDKRENGRYFTINNPFDNQAFYSWSNQSNLKTTTILEPFAGSNNLIEMLKSMKICQNFKSFDILPNHSDVDYGDTLKNFPTGFDVCVTNPPYLAQNSAKRRGLYFPDCQYDDLYKFALDKCLQNCDFVAAIIPASFLNAGIFTNRLESYILLNNKMFSDTDHPVCLALFSKKSEDAKIYYGDEFIGNLKELRKKLPKSIFERDVKFNDKNGEIGLFAIDNTKKASIYFCDGNKIDSEKICHSSRSITRISVGSESTASLIKKLNQHLENLRNETRDVFLTPFKGLRADGMYRRRLDYRLARDLINYAF